MRHGRSAPAVVTGAFFHCLHGDGEKNWASDKANCAEGIETTKNDENEYKERSFNALAKEERAKYIIYPGHKDGTPEAESDGGHGFPAEPEGNAEREPDQSCSDHWNGGDHGCEQAPKSWLIDAGHGEADAAKNALDDGNEDNAEHDASQGHMNGCGETGKHGIWQLEDAAQNFADACCVFGKKDGQNQKEENEPENIECASHKAETAADEYAYEVTEHIVKIVEYLVYGFFQSWVFS